MDVLQWHVLKKVTAATGQRQAAMNSVPVHVCAKSSTRSLLWLTRWSSTLLGCIGQLWLVWANITNPTQFYTQVSHPRSGYLSKKWCGSPLILPHSHPLPQPLTPGSLSTVRSNLSSTLPAFWVLLIHCLTYISNFFHESNWLTSHATRLCPFASFMRSNSKITACFSRSDASSCSLNAATTSWRASGQVGQGFVQSKCAAADAGATWPDAYTLLWVS